MIEKLRELEKISRELEPTAGQRKSVRNKAVSYGEDFLNRIEDIKAYDSDSIQGAGILNSPISENPITQACMPFSEIP